jgi:hypothetical protein
MTLEDLHVDDLLVELAPRISIPNDQPSRDELVSQVVDPLHCPGMGSQSEEPNNGLVLQANLVLDGNGWELDDLNHEPLYQRERAKEEGFDGPLP